MGIGPRKEDSTLAELDQPLRVSSMRHGLTLKDAFSSRRNSIAFLRWLFAVLVVVDHSYPLGGFNRGQGPISNWTVGQASLGDLSVLGFFVLSGFLVTRSRENIASTPRYLWHRCLRIFPGFWVCLAVTAFILAPIEWHHETGRWTGLFAFKTTGPLQYLRHDFLLTMHQWTIGPTLSNTPWAKSSGVAAWDGSLWTLIYEFKCYLLVAVVAVVASQALRRQIYVGLTILSTVAITLWLVNPTWVLRVLPELQLFAFLRFLFVFLLGGLAYLYADRIPITREAMVVAALVFLYTLHTGGVYIIGYVAFCYCVLCAAALLPVYRWDRFGDLSYGIYIYAFPIQMMLAARAFQRHGVYAFIATSLVLSTVAAFASWHLVEKHALRLKHVAWPRWGQLSARRSAEAIVPHDERKLA